MRTRRGNFFKNAAATIIYILALSCYNPMNGKNEINTVNSLASHLFVLNPQQVYKQYISLNDTNIFRRKLYADFIDSNKKNYSGTVKVFSYSDAKIKFNNILKLTNEEGNIYLMQLGPESFIYVKIVGGKIYSFIPIKKGNIIVGWY